MYKWIEVINLLLVYSKVAKCNLKKDYKLQELVLIKAPDKKGTQKQRKCDGHMVISNDL